jgi:hypothetical protein|tara:strand:- start:43 stop:684 length:642 start_codon:yes stop_codon:yes gene_type:complete
MANRSTTGFGLRAAMRLGNTAAIQGQSKYAIKTAPGVGIFKNNPASIQTAGDTGFIQDSGFSTTDDGKDGGIDFNTGNDSLLVGVHNGVFFIDNTTKKPTFANSVAASTAFGTNPNTGSTNGIAFVNDDPHQEYIVKTDAACGQAIFGLVGNMNDFDGTGKDGQSTTTFDTGTQAETGMFRIVRSAEDVDNEDLTAAGANIIVVMNAAANLYT